VAVAVFGQEMYGLFTLADENAFHYSTPPLRSFNSNAISSTWKGRWGKVLVSRSANPSRRYHAANSSCSAMMLMLMVVKPPAAEGVPDQFHQNGNVFGRGLTDADHWGHLPLLSPSLATSYSILVRCHPTKRSIFISNSSRF
jgi:hypothetical protein